VHAQLQDFQTRSNRQRTNTTFRWRPSQGHRSPERLGCTPVGMFRLSDAHRVANDSALENTFRKPKGDAQWTAALHHPRRGRRLDGTEYRACFYWLKDGVEQLHSYSVAELEAHIAMCLTTGERTRARPRTGSPASIQSMGSATFR